RALHVKTSLNSQANRSSPPRIWPRILNRNALVRPANLQLSRFVSPGSVTWLTVSPGCLPTSSTKCAVSGGGSGPTPPPTSLEIPRHVKHKMRGARGDAAVHGEVPRRPEPNHG